MDQPTTPVQWRRARQYLVLILVAAVLLGAWLVLTERATGQVHVTWAGRPTCTGTTVDPRGRITARLGLRCTIQVAVTNGGDRSVRLDAVVAQLSGPRTGAPLEALTIAGHPVRGEFYARARVAERISGHTTARVPIVLVLSRGQSCNAAGTHYVSGWPAVHVTAWGRGRTVDSDHDLVVRLGRAYVAGCSTT